MSLCTNENSNVVDIWNSLLWYLQQQVASKHNEYDVRRVCLFIVSSSFCTVQAIYKKYDDDDDVLYRYKYLYVVLYDDVLYDSCLVVRVSSRCAAVPVFSIWRDFAFG